MLWINEPHQRKKQGTIFLRHGHGAPSWDAFLQLWQNLRKQGVPENILIHSLSKHIPSWEMQRILAQLKSKGMINALRKEEIQDLYREEISSNLPTDKRGLLNYQNIMELEYAQAWNLFNPGLIFSLLSAQEVNRAPFFPGYLRFQANPEGILSQETSL